MKYIFKNQLNNYEIREGLITYLSKFLYPFILIIAIVTFIFIYLHGNGIIYAAIMSIMMTTLATVFTFFLLKQQLSPNKIATYKLYESELEIINNSGSIQNYRYSKTKIIIAKKVIVLCFSKGSFAIIAKRNISEELINFFSRLPNIS